MGYWMGKLHHRLIICRMVLLDLVAGYKLLVNQAQYQKGIFGTGGGDVKQRPCMCICHVEPNHPFNDCRGIKCKRCSVNPLSGGPDWNEITAAMLLAEANYRKKKHLKGEPVDDIKMSRAIERSKAVREAGKRLIGGLINDIEEYKKKRDGDAEWTE